jgi:tetratricopeptide (TPR) repeat protein
MKKFVLILLVGLSVSFYAQAQYHKHDGLPHYVDAEGFRKQGQFQKALASYDKAIRNEPSNYTYLFGKALAEFQWKDSESAKSSLESLFKLKADYAPAYLLMAQIYQQKGDANKAISFFDSAAKYEPEISNKIKYKQFAVSKYIKENEFKLAYEKLKEMYALSPKDLKIVHYYARLANANGHYKEAINAILPVENAIKALPQAGNESAKYYYELGFAFFHLGEYEKANKAWEKAKVGEFANKIERFSGKYFVGIATTYYKFRMDKEATHYIEVAEKIEEKIVDAHLLKAQISKRHTSKSNKDIRHHLEAIVKTETNVAKKEKVLADLTEMYLDSEEYDYALQTVETALKSRPDEMKLKFTKALILYKKGSYKEADAYIQDVLKQNANVDFTLLLAFNAKKNGTTELAKQTFTRLLRSPYHNIAEVELKGLK